MLHSVVDASPSSSLPEHIEVDPPSSQDPSTQLSNQALQVVHSERREAERQRRHTNGNIIPREQKKTGTPVDASLVI
jgi:hypothetical protein